MMEKFITKKVNITQVEYTTYNKVEGRVEQLTVELPFKTSSIKSAQNYIEKMVSDLNCYGCLVISMTQITHNYRMPLSKFIELAEYVDSDEN